MNSVKQEHQGPLSIFLCEKLLVVHKENPSAEFHFYRDGRPRWTGNPHRFEIKSHLGEIVLRAVGLNDYCQIATITEQEAIELYKALREWDCNVTISIDTIS